MLYKIQSIVDSLTSNSKRIFLIDALGAMLSTFFSGIILVKFEYSSGQKARTQSIFAAGGARVGILTSLGGVAP